MYYALKYFLTLADEVNYLVFYHSVYARG